MMIYAADGREFEDTQIRVVTGADEDENALVEWTEFYHGDEQIRRDVHVKFKIGAASLGAIGF
jgi:hypothetical protein